MRNRMKIIALILLVTTTCLSQKKTEQIKIPFDWKAANVYFLMTDRFNNGDKTNDINFGRTQNCGKERNYQGGDIRGVIQKIEDGYFSKLGINAIWMTPIVEQIHGGLDESWGYTYAFHGYWTKDWTAIDPNCGTKQDLKELVEKAHAKGIRILLDAVINHTGPVTEIDPVWPADWVRTEPTCQYTNFENNTLCTLTKNLPDIKTESNAVVELPPNLVEKWKKEGRYEQEVAELDAFFKRTNYPRAPKYYIIKWLTDYITDFGIDGYRVDTVKHTNEDVWVDFKKQCEIAFEIYKKENPKKVLDNNPFYTVAEVYGYGIAGGKLYDFSDKKVNYFENGFDAMINFSFRWDAEKDIETLFSSYSDKLNDELKGKSVLNYLSSHDDGNPFDAKRTKTIETGTKLLLSPGASQIYYGDETGRSLIVEQTKGDATLRSFMNWEDLKTKPETQKTLDHWQKLGQFRNNHPAVGAGLHKKLSINKSYVFGRIYFKNNVKDVVVISLHAPIGTKEITVGNLFKNGQKLKDFYSGKSAIVSKGKITINTPFDIVLLEKN